MFHSRFMLTGLLALVAVTLAAPAQRPEEVDYVIIGGGPAGFVLAEYLTRNPNIKVTLLEAGPDSSTDPLVTSTVTHCMQCAEFC
jgi:choline dehydrogenase